MKPIQLILSDLDGTLLRDDKSLSPYTQEVLRRCREKGVLFFPATARPRRALERYIHGLSYDGVMCHNGGVVVHQGAVLWEQGIAPQLRDQVIAGILEEFPEAKLSAEIQENLFANLDASQLWPGTVYTYSRMGDLPALPTEKLVVSVACPQQVERLRQLLPESLALEVSEGTLAMIQPKGVDKGSGLRGLCQTLDIPLDAVVGFGDDRNDIPLLSACGWGVAVANALPEVKNAAREVCPSNEEDGVARWLEAHLLG